MQTSTQFLSAMQSRFGTANWAVYKPFRQPLYDYVWYPTTAAPTQPLQFFAVPLGNADPNAPTTLLGKKTDEDTNVSVSMQMASNILWISAVRFHLRIMPKNRQNATVAALPSFGYRSMSTAQNLLQQVFDRGYFSCKFNQKLFMEFNRPLEAAPAAFGLKIHHWASSGDGGSPSAAATAVAWVQSNPDIGNLSDETPGIWLDPGQNIDAQLSWPDTTLTAPDLALAVGGAQPLYFQIGLWFDGYQIRPLQ